MGGYPQWKRGLTRGHPKSNGGWRGFTWEMGGGYSVDMSYAVPILLTVFNRPDTTRLVWERIRAQRPLHLYIAADGPRHHIKDEAQRCDAVRQLVSQVDWPCSVYTLFRDQNVGCRKAMAGAITWFFQQVPYGVILEDDCVPHDDFFRFCETLLHRYQDVETVGIISGSNPLATQVPALYSYAWTSYPQIWGWASWQRVWQKYDENLDDWPAIRHQLFRHVPSISWGMRCYYSALFKKIKKKQIDTWDIQVNHMTLKHRLLTVLPTHNLISNIGFGKGATHTHHAHDPMANVPAQSMVFPLQHPPDMHPDPVWDSLIATQLYPWQRRIRQWIPHWLVQWVRSYRRLM